MSYKTDFRIGYHLVDPNRRLALPAMINLFQDCGGFHGADCGYSNQGLADMGLAWIISSWQVYINEMPKLDDFVEITTYPYRVKYCMASRYFALRSPEGKEYARANSLWVMMDMKKYAPFKITKEIEDAYGPYEDHYKDFDFGGRKITHESEMTAAPPIEVTSYMIDTNHHVNNEQYVKIAQSLLPEDFKYNMFRAEYTKQARFGEFMTPYTAKTQEGYQISLCDADGEAYFTGEWTQR